MSAGEEKAKPPIVGVSGSYGPSPLAGTIYTVPKKPKSCDECGRKGMAMYLINLGTLECSRIPCPHRDRVTARPSDKPGDPQ